MSTHQNAPTTLKEKLQNLFKPTPLHQPHSTQASSVSSSVQHDDPAKFGPTEAISPAALNLNTNDNTPGATSKSSGSSVQPITKDNVQPLIILDASWVSLARELPAETRIKTLRSLRQQLVLPPELSSAAPGKSSPHSAPHATTRVVKIPSVSDIDALWAHCFDILLLPSASQHLSTTAAGDTGPPQEISASDQNASGGRGAGAAQLLQHEAKLAFLSLANAMLLLSKTYQHHLNPSAPNLVENKPLKQQVVNGLLNALEVADIGRSEAVSADNEYLLMALETLSIATDGGKRIEYVETTLPQFLRRWLTRFRTMPLAAGAVPPGGANELHKVSPLNTTSIAAKEETGEKTLSTAKSLPPVSEHICAILSLLTNMIHYQKAAVGNEIVDRSVDFVSRQLLLVTRKTNAVEAGIQLIDAVVCHAFLPVEFQHVVLFLCKTVNVAVEEVASQSWRTMRNILSTTLGLKAVQYLCDLLENQQVVDAGTSPSNVDSKDAARGAVYFIGMALWGSKRVTTLQITASSVLPSIAAALRNQNDLVLHYEVLLCLHRFLKKHGSELDVPAYEQVVEMVQILVDSYYAAVAAMVGTVPAAPDAVVSRRSTFTLNLAPREPPHMLLNPYRHELGQILTTLCEIYTDKHRRDAASSTSSLVLSPMERRIDAALLCILETAMDLLAPEQISTVVIAERIKIENFVDVDEFLIENSASEQSENAENISVTDAALPSSTRAQAGRSLFSQCIRRCLCGEREQVQLDLLKQLERFYQKLAPVATEQQMTYFVDVCIMLNFQNVAFVAALTSTSDSASLHHYAQTPAVPITPSANVGMRKIKLLTQIADNLNGSNFTKLADLLLINLANCMAVAYHYLHQPHTGGSSHLSHLLHFPSASLTSAVSVPHFSSVGGSGGTSPGLTSTTPLSAFLLPPVPTSSIMTAKVASNGSSTVAKPVYDACVTSLPDELLRLFARKMFDDQVFEANYVYERLMALLACLYSKNQLHGKLNSMCRRKIFRGLSSLTANENGSVCFVYHFDGSEKAVHYESALLKAFMPPNADYWFDDEDESNGEGQLEKLRTVVDEAANANGSAGNTSPVNQRRLTESMVISEGAAPDSSVTADQTTNKDAENAGDITRRGHTPTFSNQSSSTSKHHQPSHIEMFDVSLLLKNIITCINRERDWDVLSVVLADLPLLLRNHPLLIAVVARAQHATPKTTVGGASVAASPTAGLTLQQQRASLAALARQRRTVSSASKLAQNSGGRAGSISSTVSTPSAVSHDHLSSNAAAPSSVSSSTSTVAAATNAGTSKSESDDEPPHNLVEQLASALCQLCLDRERSDPANLYNIPASLTRSAVHERVFPALASMASCAVFIGVESQQHIIKCLEQCLDSRNARLPLRALTLCLMQFAEMRMTKLLPSVLVSVMKISSSERNSTHMLEFLSNLVNLPHLYRNFVDEQFRSMFALALPYTNPYRFSNYAVALAYVTLASWFLRSRVLFRKEFVRFIVKGLKSNLLMSDSARQNMSRQSQALALEAASTDGSALVVKAGPSGNNAAGNAARKESTAGIQSNGDDSPLRRRTQSVNAAQYQRMKAAAAAQAASAGHDPHVSSPSLAGKPASSVSSSNSSGCESLHDSSGTTAKFERGLLYELIETFVDLMERHAFGNVVPQPPKTATPLDVFPPERLQSKTWLLGYRMVRITTLGPGSVSSSSTTDSTATITAVSGRALRKEVLGIAGGAGSSLLSPRTRGRTLEAAFAHGAVATTAHQQSLSHRRATTEGVLAGTPAGASHANGRSMSIVPSSPAAKSGSSDGAKVPSPAVTNGGTAHSETDTNKSLSPADQKFFYADVDSLYSHHSRSSSKSRVIEEEGDDDNVDGTGDYVDSPGFATTALRTSCSDSALAAASMSTAGTGLMFPDSFAKLGISSPSANYGNADDNSPDSAKTKSSENESNFDDAGITIGSSSAVRKELRHRHPTSPPSSQQQHQMLPPSWVLVQQQRQLNAAATLLSASSWVLIHVRTATGVTQWTMKMDNFMLFSLPSLLSVKHDAGSNDSAFPSAGDNGGYPSLSWPLSGSHVGTADGMYNAEGGGGGGGSTEFGVNDGSSGGTAGHYIDPAFVFLHLFCTHLTGERPLLLPKSDAVERAVKVLDRIHPYETHKIGVIYCAPHQRPSDETAMLSNTSGSLRYMNFLAGLGELVSLASVDPEVTYTGGLDCSSSAEDGRFTYVWRTFLTQLVFHVTTLMPNRESDPKFTGKKLHIGNDFVNIVYNESKTDEDFRINTLKGQFVMACVVVHPLALGINSVRVLVREDLRDVLPQWQAAPAVSTASISSAAVAAQQAGGGYYAQEDIVTDRFLPSFVRQTAMHLNLACRIFKEERKSTPSMSGNEYPFVSNWFERLRQLKRIRYRLTQDVNVAAAGSKSAGTTSASDSGGGSGVTGKQVQYFPQTSTTSTNAASANFGTDARRRFDSYGEVDIDFTDFL